MTRFNAAGLFLSLMVGCASFSQPVVMLDENTVIRAQSFDGSFTGENKTDESVFKAEDKIAQVIIEGNKTIPASAILPLVRTRADSPVKGAETDIRQDITKLYDTGWFFSVEARFRKTPVGIVLVFLVEERPILQKVEFRGNKEGIFSGGVRDKTLQNLTGLVEGHAFSVGINKEAVRRIKEYYKEKGFRFAEVTLVKGGDPNDREVIININEGPKVRVQKISFDGNSILSDNVLALKIASKKAKLHYFGGTYDPEQLADDVTALKSFYHNLGYFDVAVKENVLLSDDKSSVALHYDIQEGVRYQISSIKFSGNEVFNTAYLSNDLEVAPGALYKQLDINKDLQKVNDKYNNAGRLFSKIEAKPVFNGMPGKVDLVYQIKEDKIRYIGRINVNIRGDKPYSRETLVLNQLLFAPGDLANADLIRRSKDRLGRSAIWQGQAGLPPNINLKPVEGEIYARAGESKTYRGQSPVLEQISKSLTDPDSVVPPAWEGLLNSGDIILHRQDAEELPVIDHEVPIIRTLSEEPDENGIPNQSAVSRQKVLQAVNYYEGHSIPRQDQEFNTPGTSKTSNFDNFDPQKYSSKPISVKHDSVFNQSTGNAQNISDSAEAEPQITEQLFPDADELFSREGFSFINGPAETGEEETNDYLPCQLYDQTNGMIIRGQSYDANGMPPNPVYNNTPSGDIFGQQLRNPEPPAFVDVDVDVSESQTGRFMFSVGVNSDSGVVASVVLEEQNFDITNFPRRLSDWGNGAFRGNGEQFRIEAVPGNQVSRYLVNWTNPYFMGTNYSLGLSGFYYNRFFESYEERRLGGRVQVGRMLSRFLSANVAVRLEEVEVRNPATTLVKDLNDVVGKNFLGTVKPGLVWDTRDSTFMPSNGTYLEGSAEQAFADFNFTKLEFTAKKYYTVYQRIDNAGRHVLAFSGNLGWTTDNTPLFERFYAGGVQTFRGFQFRGVTPRVGTTPTGGFWQVLGSTEYILPVTAGENFRLIAFSDYGTVDDTISLDKFRVSVGGGLRITIPQMGPVPIALDWAVPLVREDRDNTRVFQFYIGFTR